MDLWMILPNRNILESALKQRSGIYNDELA
jgi:hypothetical protein